MNEHYTGAARSRKTESRVGESPLIHAAEHGRRRLELRVHSYAGRQFLDLTSLWRAPTGQYVCTRVMTFSVALLPELELGLALARRHLEEAGLPLEPSQ